MATVTLTPLHYYQVDENFSVTEIDPTTKKVQDQKKSVVVEFAYANSFKHGHITNMAFSLSGRSGDDDFSIYKTESAVAPAIGETILPNKRNSPCFTRLSGANEFNFLDSFPYGYSTFLLWIDPGYTNTSFSFRSLTLTLTYTTGSFMTASMSPKTGFLDPTKAKTFTFSVGTSTTVLSRYAAVSGTLHYKLTSAVSYTDLPMTFSGTPYTFTLPANTLAGASEYSIYATITGDDGTTADTAVGTFSTVDGLPQVTPIAPKNAITEGEALFQWSYYNEKGTQQYAYEIAYSANGGALQYPTGKVVSNANSALLTIPEAGTIAWKIKAWNQDNVASDWSDPISFINQVPPNAPTIVDIMHAGRPTIYWSAANQIAYQVEVYENDVLVYNSGEVYSADQSHNLKHFLPDGAYEFRVKIFNTLGMSSPWSSDDYQQSFSGLPDIVFTAEPEDDGVVITLTPDATYSHYYLQRNGTIIAELTESTYLDRFAGGVEVYTIIGVTATEASAFASQTVEYMPTNTTIKTEDGRTIDASKRWTQRIVASKAVTPEVGVFSYIGASRPEVIASKMRTIRYTFGFFDQDRIAEDLLGTDVFYSDIYGNAEWCRITAVTRTEAWYGNETALELTGVLHDEEIDVA